MRSKISDSNALIFILSFLSSFKLACDTNRVPEGLSFHCYTLSGSPWFCRPKPMHQIEVEVAFASKEVHGNSVCEAADYGLQTYSVDDITAESDDDIKWFPRFFSSSPTEKA